MAIQIKLHKTDEDLFCKSKWWGNPDIPADFVFDDSLMFLCQIRCDDLVDYDEDNILPHNGMLYFFCDVAYYLGYYDDFEPQPSSYWNKDAVKVYYVNDVDESSFKQIIFDDDYFPQIKERKVEFELTDDESPGFKLLGLPYMLEYENWPPPYGKYINLLQVDSEDDDDFDLMFMDMGLLYLIINPKDLKRKDFSKVRGYLYST